MKSISIFPEVNASIKSVSKIYQNIFTFQDIFKDCGLSFYYYSCPVLPVPFFKLILSQYIYFPFFVKKHAGRVNHFLSSHPHLLFFVPTDALSIIDIHHVPIEENRLLQNKIYTALARKGLQRAAQIIVPSLFTKKELELKMAIPSENITVIQHGVDHNRFFPRKKNDMRDILHLPKDKKIFLHVGSELRRKNIERFFYVFSQIVKQDDQIVLVRIGHCTKQSRRLLKKLHIDNHVLYRENVSENDLALYYNAADALIFPSLLEGFGMPLLEAMASGTPIICSDIPAFREIAQDTAWYFDPKSHHSFFQAILSFFSDTIKVDVKVCAALRISQNYSWERCAQERAGVYIHLFHHA